MLLFFLKTLFRALSDSLREVTFVTSPRAAHELKNHRKAQLLRFCTRAFWCFKNFRHLFLYAQTYAVLENVLETRFSVIWKYDME